MQEIPVRIASDSMEPLLRTGEVIKAHFFQSLEDKQQIYKLKKFDLILFEATNGVTCHFFWKHQDQLILTRSLKNPTDNDFPTEKNKVIGVIKNKKLKFKHKFYVYTKCLFSRSF